MKQRAARLVLSRVRAIGLEFDTYPQVREYLQEPTATLGMGDEDAARLVKAYHIFGRAS